MLIYITHNYLNRPGYMGIKKKVISQTKVFRKHFGAAYYTMCCEGMVYLMDGNQPVDKAMASTRQMINEVISSWIEKYQVDKTYIRYEYSSNPWFLRFLAQQKARGVRYVLEIPTYPYDHEISHGRLKIEDGTFRGALTQYVDRISTYSEDKTIWGIPCINLINGVDLEQNPLRKRKTEDKKIVLIGIGSFSPWHGYERVITGLHNYYSTGGDYNILFKLIGAASGKNRYLSLVKQYNLQDHVEFCGRLDGDGLNRQYDMADIAISSLAIKIQNATPIKSAEYCARGIPMINGYDDLRFPKSADYIMRVPNTADSLNIRDVIDFYHKTASQEDLGAQMRQYAADHLTWDHIMQPVVEYLKMG